ncbi:hypothetical protein EPA93_21445 [Ktedonosporobacter rubrisoli]|uniref:Uncharacterized protein n=1 Tax=Ktedonosporobacter rubrisoli TaxID=2509675 RepID=A0A4V0YZ43_KTERU|nr:hypothetical protein [Ktedonosporobacter rubrisoli]QBD78421.1 hypothetical protein EPA93_21445 [Ktedonosporobacter rubrisoli]
MTRKDSEKDAERSHYYSQFWLDVAAGRRIIGAPKPSEEAEQAEAEQEAAQTRKSARVAEPEDHSSNTSVDGQAETIVHPVAEPISAPEEFIEPENGTEGLELDVSDEEQDLQEMSVDDTDIPDVDLSSDEEEEDEDLYAEDEEEEEEDEDLDWSARGRKKNRPGRPVKQPLKKSRREPRRGF